MAAIYLQDQQRRLHLMEFTIAFDKLRRKTHFVWRVPRHDLLIMVHAYDETQCTGRRRNCFALTKEVIFSAKSTGDEPGVREVVLNVINLTTRQMKTINSNVQELSMHIGKMDFINDLRVQITVFDAACQKGRLGGS